MQVGVKLARIRLDECTSPAEMMELVRTGGDDAAGHVDHRRGLEREQLHRRPLAHAPRHRPGHGPAPVILMRFFNMDVINTVGLKLAGVDKATPDPEGGRIEREADGTPNGILRAAAKLLVRNLILRPTQAELVEAVRLGCADMHRFGITSVIDPGLMPFEVSAYQAAYAQGKLSVRTNLMLSWHGFREEETEAELDARHVHRSDDRAGRRVVAPGRPQDGHRRRHQLAHRVYVRTVRRRGDRGQFQPAGPGPVAPLLPHCAGARLGRGIPPAATGPWTWWWTRSAKWSSLPNPDRATTSSTPTSRPTAPWTRWAGTTSAR
ncbi:MAG: amidohydrolase family protein [Caldilineaceae bacterium]